MSVSERYRSAENKFHSSRTGGRTSSVRPSLSSTGVPSGPSINTLFNASPLGPNKVTLRGRAFVLTVLGPVATALVPTLPLSRRRL